MNIRLDLIKASPRPVRTSWDEDKMNELAQSIREQGVIVPVKVRASQEAPLCPKHGFEVLTMLGTDDETDEFGYRDVHWRYDADAYSEHENCPGCTRLLQWNNRQVGRQPVRPFELVYGHRRVEAARRAGLDEIPAIVEGVDDTDALVQALIENVQREDMEPIEEAQALATIMEEKGISSYSEVGRQGIMSRIRANRLGLLLRQPLDVISQVGKGEDEDKPLKMKHIIESGAGDHGDQRNRSEVLRKAARERLSSDQTRRVAEAVRDAPDEETKQALIDTPVERDTDIWEGAARIAVQDKKREKKERREMAPEVKELLEDIKRGRRILERGKDSVRMGKMGPEHAPYIANQLRKYAEWLNEWADELDRFREEMVNG